ncbi:tyrosine-type recombinase/integrase [Vallitalea guaymasensis]|uniref:Tyrosine-type recombinase/integrase n=1 Tax=Vallitalea guaymasensis TaxID=1185412 RepID=A0A8J8SF10_9FIRM|nr:tyrosine-type recombinase/integrase [Vallitalea guaymasensis]QUH32111.1 tyrosine-type recombinase/integrase [Vallitalea guaymasensis]
MKNNDYHEQQNIKNSVILREIMYSLPSFTFEFFRGIEQTTSSKTRIAYAYDLRLFFEFILEYHKDFKDKDITHIELKELSYITPDDIEMYLEYLSYYKKEDKKGHIIEHKNTERGKSRKLASLRSFFTYFYKKQKITNNPALLVDLPKIHNKNITRLEIDEVARLLDEVESGDKLTQSQKKYHKLTKDRDLALMTLLLGTGIRVSECVGLNISDIDFNVNGIRIVRKGGNEVIIYFGDEVESALMAYLDNRKHIIPVSGHEDALFLSLQHKRLSVRSVQNLVKKYSKLVTNLKNISPHKLRSTYGTNLYRETGDIYLVADVLGHKDVNTTKKHYAQIEDARRRQAAKVIKLRKD